jgi:hypothetical protein
VHENPNTFCCSLHIIFVCKADGPLL